jgi:uncharacterized protein (DUF433 family)
METKTLGQYIVADPAICHGKPTFRGTRILVADVLEQVKSGMVWEAIIEEWRGTLTEMRSPKQSAIAREAPAAYAPKLVSEPVIA